MAYNIPKLAVLTSSGHSQGIVLFRPLTSLQKIKFKYHVYLQENANRCYTETDVSEKICFEH